MSLRSLWLFVSWAAMVFVLAMLLATAGPLALGDRPYVVRSGSMSPAIDTGDVVVVKPIAPAEARVGDIVTFEDSEGRLITHRARAIEEGPKHFSFVTQGDANTTQERWRVASDGEIGRVRYRIPMLGYVAEPISSPPGRVALLIVPALLLGGSLLSRIWRSEPPEEADAARA